MDSSSKPKTIPEHLIYPIEEFAESFAWHAREGERCLGFNSVAFVGLARNCGPHLKANLKRLEILSEACGGWFMHVETNDNTDDTVAVLEEFCERYPNHASYRDQTLGRQQFSAEFAGPRTIALAEYRAACQQWVRENAADTLFTVVLDWDAWGGWSHAGLLNGVGWMVELPGAYGMASVSLMEHPMFQVGEDGKGQLKPAWLHYDCWAMRGVGQPTNYWDDYTAGQGGWKHQWIPPVGSDPILVASAFGGMTIYRTEDYLAGTYDGGHDCEHTAFHESIAKRRGSHLFYNPSQRCVMRWLEEVTDGGQHG